MGKATGKLGYAAVVRAQRSRARLASKWRPLMETWARFRGATWKVDRLWTARRLLVHAEILKGGGEWTPLPGRTPHVVALVDESIADLAGCVVARGGWDDEDRRFRARDPWDRLMRQFPDVEKEPYWYEDDDPAAHFFEDRQWLAWDRKISAAREHEADLLLVHYLLPHVRMYQKLRALELSERAYYYRLGSALSSIGRTYSYLKARGKNVQF